MMTLQDVMSLGSPNTKDEVLDAIAARREALEVARAIEEQLSETLDHFTGTVKDAMEIGLVKAAFPYKIQRRY